MLSPSNTNPSINPSNIPEAFIAYENGILKSHLQRAFIKKILISEDELYTYRGILTEQGKEYNICISSHTIHKLATNPTTQLLLIVSFQQWKDGNNYAIAKEYMETKDNNYYELNASDAIATNRPN